jgi:hypothetical protein
VHGHGAGNFLEDGRISPPIVPVTTDSNRMRAFEPLLRMWPPVSLPLVCALTVSTPHSSILLQGDPALWESATPARGVHESPRVPFALIEGHGFALSVCVSDNADVYETYVSWDARAVETYDLRLARFHLLRQPWLPGSNAASPATEMPPPRRQTDQSPISSPSVAAAELPAQRTASLSDVGRGYSRGSLPALWLGGDRQGSLPRPRVADVAPNLVTQASSLSCLSGACQNRYHERLCAACLRVLCQTQPRHLNFGAPCLNPCGRHFRACRADRQLVDNKRCTK